MVYILKFVVVKGITQKSWLVGDKVRAKPQVSFHLVQDLFHHPDDDLPKIVELKYFFSLLIFPFFSFFFPLKTLQNLAVKKKIFKLICITSAYDEL